MKDNPYIFQPITDMIFHIDKDKKKGFERRILIFVIIISIISIVHAWISMS